MASRGTFQSMKEHEERLGPSRGRSLPIKIDKVLVWGRPALTLIPRRLVRVTPAQFGGDDGLQVATGQPPRCGVVHDVCVALRRYFARLPTKKPPEGGFARCRKNSVSLLKLAQCRQLCHQHGQLRLSNRKVNVTLGIFQRFLGQSLGCVGFFLVQVFATNRGV